MCEDKRMRALVGLNDRRSKLGQRLLAPQREIHPGTDHRYRNPYLETNPKQVDRLPQPHQVPIQWLLREADATSSRMKLGKNEISQSRPMIATFHNPAISHQIVPLKRTRQMCGVHFHHSHFCRNQKACWNVESEINSKTGIDVKRRIKLTLTASS